MARTYRTAICAGYIEAPFGNIAVGICYDSRRKHIYDNMSDKIISLILFPHGQPSDPNKQKEEQLTLNYYCNTYVNAFAVPVVYCNNVGAMRYMMGNTGRMMQKAGFALCGNTKIYGTSNHLEKIMNLYLVEKPEIFVFMERI